MKTSAVIIMQCDWYYDRVCQLYSRSTCMYHPKRTGEKEKKSFLENVCYKILKTLLNVKRANQCTKHLGDTKLNGK